MDSLPRGVVTFLFTDVEGSTRLWEEASDTMMAALGEHDRLIDAATVAHHGVGVKPRGEGDSRFVVFASASEAVAAAADMQRSLAVADWPTPRPLRVRISLHTGDAALQLGDYYGPSVNRAARLRAIAHGGQTILSEATRNLVHDHLAPGLSLADMGRHRLKDLTRPEHVYQLDVEGLDTAFPPLASLDLTLNNLPTQLTDFIGRKVELDDLKTILGRSRMVTVLAPGGTGKTRLAIQAAAELSASFPDGVFFVDLAPVEAPDRIVQAVAEAMGLALSSDQDVRTQLYSYLTNKHSLVVFDNFEHLLGGREIIPAILKAAPRLTIVSTSRTALGLTGETLFTLGGLETTRSEADEIVDTEAAALFLDAARRAKPHFSITGADLASLGTILRLTDGMPLAIVLAAAWVSLLTIEEIATEMTTSLDFLETTAGDVPDRQRSVRAIFEYTWALLTPAEQRVFAAVSVFRGGFNRLAAEAVAGASLRELAALAGKSLLAADSETGRYTIHELLRQYAETELARDSEAQSQVLGAHANYYRDLATDVYPPGTRPADLAVLESDIDNLRRAWHYFLDTHDASAAGSLVGPLWSLYEVRGWYLSAVDLFQHAIDVFEEGSGESTVEETRALATAVQAWFLALLGRSADGETASTRAVRVLRESGDKAALWLALISLAINRAYTGQDFASTAEEGMSVGRDLDDSFREATFKNWRGGAALMVGDFSTSRELLAEGMSVFEDIGEKYWLSANLQHQAQLATAEGRAGAAVHLYDRSTRAASEIGAVRILQMSSAGLGDANLAIGSHGAAEAAYLQSLVTSEKMGMRHEMLSLVNKIASIRAATGQGLEAIRLLSAVLAETEPGQKAVFDRISIEEAARATLDELRNRLPAEEFAVAEVDAAMRPLEVVVKELLASRTT